ncbi:MAG: acetylornithine deacetylase [Bacteroidetes bacterium GWF2_42_66]|nr:MAG: acetylornithine deacetylase [Bacteroidetes bacterium GWA2_42_15]OFX99377.1 MAG: acetylornithine deacetylase [Bacteroidetes bacterium GWE2_42_39]OFY40429.1 MAG: acetylornithine deacetylase [Bacteroidetes bacterium GWF2_42_66]HBL76950.1 acetylornithine deacetylase [Prolixibacteraceae bacterium]HCR90812.1 acetylornithine deacetylase [Prolixibacteraceae bacterium]
MNEYIQLLQKLISTQSFSGEEENAAQVIQKFLNAKSISFHEKGNNTWAKNKFWKEGLPVVLLNSHIDTVKPARGYTRDPFQPTIEDGKLYGLGSNDAGGALVSLLSVFVYFYEQEKLPFNLIFAASSEEEISGTNGIESILSEIEPVDLAIVGEPTLMQMAIAEKGLMVLDCTAYGKSGHAARNEGINAIYKAIGDIEILRNYKFEKSSDLLGEVKMTVSMINAGTQHNVVPDTCSFVVDVRTNEYYSNEKACQIISELIESEVEPRSFRLNSSGIPVSHPIVQRGLRLGLTCYGSPTTSDQAVMPYMSIKIGPGDSARSHTADEFIYVREIEEAFGIYTGLLENLRLK